MTQQFFVSIIKVSKDAYLCIGSSFFLCLPPKLSNGKCEPYVGSSSIVVYIVEMGPVSYIELLVVTIRVVDLFCNL